MVDLLMASRARAPLNYGLGLLAGCVFGGAGGCGEKAKSSVQGVEKVSSKNRFLRCISIKVERPRES